MITDTEKNILILDDEINILTSYKITLNLNGYSNIHTCSNPEELFFILKNRNINLLLLDLILPNHNGIDLLDEILLEYPDIAVIIISGINEVATAVKCIKKGAYDYIVKPTDKEQLISCIKRTFSALDIKIENLRLKKLFLNANQEINPAFSEIITINSQMKGIFKYCEAVACSSQPILVTGETGTGKELIAKAIYKIGNFRGKYIPVNIAGLDTHMFTDTLFGHKRGAFTGASESRDGLLKSAENGVLFLDEIGDLSIQSQVKLLRLLQEHEYTPLGSDTSKLSNAKFVLGTNRNLEEMVEKEEFRKDLFYRLSMHQIHLPPLRERLEDICLIFDKFLEEAAIDLRKKKPSYHPELISLLCTYNYPGNIRELHGMIYNALSKHKAGMLSSSEFEKHINKNIKAKKADIIQGKCGLSEIISNLPILPNLKDIPVAFIEEALKRTKGNQRLAAKMLGISPQALSKRLKTDEK